MLAMICFKLKRRNVCDYRLNKTDLELIFVESGLTGM